MRIFLKILAAPVTLTLSLLVWIGVLLVDRAAFLLQIASGILTILAVVVFFATSATNGLILFGIAALISPLGLPMLAAKLLGGLQRANMALKELVH